VLWWIAVLRWVLCSVFVALICDCGDTVQVHAVYNKQMWFQLELVRFLLRIPDALRTWRCAPRSVFAFPSA
jgi:hypothetical protein